MHIESKTITRSSRILSKLSSSSLPLGRSTFLLLQYFLYGLAPWRRNWRRRFLELFCKRCSLPENCLDYRNGNLLEIRFPVSHRSLSFGCVQRSSLSFIRGKSSKCLLINAAPPLAKVRWY